MATIAGDGERNAGILKSDTKFQAFQRIAMSTESDTPANEAPFKIQVAERVTRLPPYLFGRINGLLYNKRRAGDDVIDLGMGNPSDPPEDFVVG